MPRVLPVLGGVVVVLGIGFALLQLVTPFDPLACSLSNRRIGCRPLLFGGHVEKGLEPIEQMFRKRFEDGLEVGAQLAIYHKGKLVVNLWGGYTDSAKPYDEHSLVNVFSSGKLLECVAIAKLVDQGVLDYNETVAHYWPEFAANGKENITVHDVMQHSAGLAYDLSFKAPLVWDPDKLAADLAKEEPSFPNNTRRAYHAVTRGYILNEIIRRTDPKGRTIGKYLFDELNEGFLNSKTPPTWYSPNLMPKEKWAQVSRWIKPNGLFAFKTFILPVLLQKVLPFLPILPPGRAEMIARFSDPNSSLNKAMNVLEYSIKDDMNNMYLYNATEMTSGNTIANARSLAMVAAAFSQQIPSKLASAEAYKRAMANQKAELDDGIGTVTHLPDGGIVNFKDMRTPGWYGGAGYGGSLAIWHPELELALGYSCNGSKMPMIEIPQFIAEFFAKNKQ